MAFLQGRKQIARFSSAQTTIEVVTPPARASLAFPILLLLFSLLLSLLAGLLAYFELQYRGRIYPGVRVEPLELGGKTPAEARQMLEALYAGAAPWWPLLTFGDKAWIPSQADLGIEVDLDAAVEEAYRVGRSSNVLRSLAEQRQALRQGYTIRPTARLEPAQARRYLSVIAREVNRPVREATLRVNGTRVEILPSQVGYEVDESATLEQLAERIRNWQGGELPLVVREIQPLITNLEGLAERVQRILSAPLVLVGPANLTPSRWVLTPEELAGMLVLEQRVENDGSIAGIATLSAPALQQRAEAIAQEVNRPPVEGKIDYNLNTRQLVVIQPSQLGYRLDVERTVQLIQEHALSQMREISLPVETITPTIDTDHLEALGLNDILVEATTNFKGSSRERMTNIALAAERFDGILLAPGEIFSFNKYLGEVSAEQGFAESLIIWGDQTAVGIGGGICQVSTTAFRAAFWAGLEIIERWAHGYRVSWYEPPVGMDATVYGPVVDFKFRNDTPAYLLIKTKTDLTNGTITFYFIGTDTGRTVEMEGPFTENVIHPEPPEYREDPSLPAGTVKQVEWQRDGVDVTVKRIVRQGDTIIHRDVFFSRYRPWRAVFLVGTGPAAGQ
ncbi:MAG: VanW family protein [Anaerolineae bacterium]